jgi:hypothetical protein
MFEWHMGWKEPEPKLDRDRVVTLTVGQLTDALAEALRVVQEVPAEPQWKKGDRAYVEVEVTGGGGNNVNVVLVGNPGPRSSICVTSESLKEIA